MTETTVDASNDATILPPLGQITEADWGKVHQYLNGILQQDNEALQGPCQQADLNKTIYRHGWSRKPRDGSVVSNSIRDDVLTSVTQIMREDPEITLAPVETGQGGVPFVLQTPNGPQVITIDDRFKARFWQRQFDYYWSKGRINKAIKAAILNAAIAGWTFPMFEWERSSKKPKLWTTISPRQIGIDPNVGPVDAVDEASHMWVRWYVERWRARRMYPHLAEVIEKRAREGPPRSDGITQLGSNVDRNYRQKMVDIKHFFLRDQPVLEMTEDEAVNAGLVEVVQGELGTDSYILAGTQTPVTPGSPLWPWWTGLRQITLVDEIVADDKQCEYWDMPFGHFCMIPNPNSPFGIGIPEGMLAMQDARNSMLTDVKDHTSLLAHPPLVISESTARDLDIKKENPFLRRDKIYVAPDDLLARTNGKLTTTIEPPPLHEATIQGLEIFKAEMSERSQSREVTQGKQPGQVTGWQAISLLQQAASNQYDLEAQFAADLIWRIAKLLLHELFYRLSVQDLMQVCSEYPPELVEAMKQMAVEGEWDIQVEVYSSIAGVQARKKAENYEKFAMRDPFGRSIISLQTLRERTNEDHQTEEQRLAQEMMQGMAQQAMMNPNPDEEGHENGNGKPGSNGDSGGNPRGNGNREPASPAEPRI